MYNYTIDEVVDAYNLKKKANESYKEVLGNGDGDNSLQ
jgi:hypothetical protein